MTLKPGVPSMIQDHLLSKLKKIKQYFEGNDEQNKKTTPHTKRGYLPTIDYVKSITLQEKKPQCMSSKYKEEMKEKFKEDVKIIKCSNVYEKFKCV